MNDLVQTYINELSPRVADKIHGTALLVITGEGCVMLNKAGAHPGGETDTADVKLISSDAVFRDIMSGDQNPVMAFMSGKLKVEGNPKRALKVSSILIA